MIAKRGHFAKSCFSHIRGPLRKGERDREETIHMTILFNHKFNRSVTKLFGVSNSFENFLAKLPKISFHSCTFSSGSNEASANFQRKFIVNLSKYCILFWQCAAFNLKSKIQFECANKAAANHMCTPKIRLAFRWKCVFTRWSRKTWTGEFYL